MRRSVAAGAVLAAVLLAGCGGGDTGGSAKPNASATTGAGQGEQGGQGKPSATGDGKPKTDPGKPAAPPLTDAQLSTALLNLADISGYMFQEWPISPRDTLKTSPAECQPIFEITIPSKTPAPKAAKGQMALSMMGPTNGSGFTVVLLSYEQSDAEKLLGNLRTALEKCTAYEGGAPARTTVKPLKAPDAGDEAVAFHLSSANAPSSYVTVVRRGSTAALFLTAPYDKKPVEPPKELIDAQVKKLG
ncbi:hypothetical protein [Streptomyces sp. NPDC051909]|uniref:hypothetical protein n=1 Tax=Streptomyces sp. NPDC051909 TaxID=3154944 RepID=UPI0034303B6C